MIEKMKKEEVKNTINGNPFLQFKDSQSYWQAKHSNQTLEQQSIIQKQNQFRKQSIERKQKFFYTLRTYYQAKRKLTKYGTKARKSWIPEGGFLYFDPKFIQRDSCWELSLWYRLQLAMLLESTKQNAVLNFRGTEKRLFLFQKKRSERSRLNSHLLTA